MDYPNATQDKLIILYIIKKLNKYLKGMRLWLTGFPVIWIKH